MPIEVWFGEPPPVPKAKPAPTKVDMSSAVPHFEYKCIGGLWTFHKHQLRVKWPLSDGSWSPFQLALFDSWWNEVEEWGKQNTRFFGLRVDKESGLLYFRRKADAMHFKLTHG